MVKPGCRPDITPFKKNHPVAAYIGLNSQVLFDLKVKVTAVEICTPSH